MSSYTLVDLGIMAWDLRINDNDVVTGMTADASGREEAFTYKNNVMQILQVPAGSIGWPWGMNNNGPPKIAGWTTSFAGPRGKAALWGDIGIALKYLDL